MWQRAVPQSRLQRMSKGVAQVQQAPFAALVRIAADQEGFLRHARGHHIDERVRLLPCECRLRLLDTCQACFTFDDGCLEGLTETGEPFCARQSRQIAHIRHHDRRLVKGPHEVLAGAQVDGSLAAHRGVHLRQQRGRHLGPSDAAIPQRGRKASRVAHDAAA